MFACPDLLGQPEGVEQLPDGRVDGAQDHPCATALQLVADLAQGVRPRVVKVAHRGGIKHEPLERRIGTLDDAHDLLGEAGRVRVEELRAEGVDEEAGCRLDRLVDRGERARAVGGDGDDPVVGLVDMHQHEDE